MKLRIRGDSLRLRVTREELRQIAAGREVADRIQFTPTAALSYRLVPSDEVARTEAAYEEGAITVRLPGELARRWSTTDEVGVRAEQPLGDSGLLSILIEKDFACLQPREGEDESDMFAHPNACG